MSGTSVADETRLAVAMVQSGRETAKGRDMATGGSKNRIIRPRSLRRTRVRSGIGGFGSSRCGSCGSIILLVEV